MPENQPEPWRTLVSRPLVERPPWIVLREDRVELPTGAVLDPYFVVEAPDWACVVPVLASGEVVMVEQWRHAIGRRSLEFPAGAIDRGETPEAAAVRELQEEAGVVAGSLVPLAMVATEPARMTNWAHLFLAPEAKLEGVPVPDASEDLAIRVVPTADLASLIASGEIVHGVHVGAALLAQARLGAREPAASG